MPDTDNGEQPKPAVVRRLPPGVILGPDGKPCKICTVFRNWRPDTRTSKTPAASTNKNNGFSTTASAMAALAGFTKPQPVERPEVRPEHCPPDVEALGRATWTFLHSTAAYYPERPSQTQRAHMLNLLHSLPTLYPCSHCASHLGEALKTNPPQVGTRTVLSQWLCRMHNDVNDRLGKPTFKCDMQKLDERWKDGPEDGSCD